MFIYYVYAYMSNDGLPYYIGKGKGNRAFDNNHRVPVPKDKTEIIFLETNLSNIGALALERRMISWYGRLDIGTGILLNKTDGGEVGSLGYKHSEETLKKISEANKGKPAHNTGKSMSAESRKKLSDATKNRKPISIETRKKLSDALKGNTRNKGNSASEETRKKMSEAHQGKLRSKHSEETLKKISNALKGKPSHNKGKPCSEETKEKLSNALKGKPAHNRGKSPSSEARKKMSDAAKQRHIIKKLGEKSP